jgi:hypothetical protein
VTSTSTATYTDLPRSYRVPMAVVGLGILLIAINLWLGAALGLFGLFLLVQTLTLTLRFTETALDIYRGEQQIRTFPYADWQHWEIFWAPVPVLLYFREVNSIHFLPILFGPTELRACLDAHCAFAKDPS